LQITFLGTSAGMPTRSRNVSSVALRLLQRGEVWLFDCGEGTQHQIIKSELSLSKIRRIFITHLHGDHVFGLMGLLATCGLAGTPSSIDVYGPRGLNEYLTACGLYSQTHFAFPLRVHSVLPGPIYEDAEFLVTCEELRHRVEDFGYRVTEKDRPGSLDSVRAADLGIPAGPLYGRLKRGEVITLPDGRVINGADLVGPKETGRRIAYCTDTTYSEGAIELAADADLLIHEATYAQRDEELALRSLHSTSSIAARVASAANAKRLILTHISPRYGPGDEIGPDDLLNEARAIFPNTELAHDFLTVEVPRRGRKPDH
jgi:ribonuclease Z